MKIILSRKGFDTKNGEKPSCVLPDGGVISLPIPSLYKEPTEYSDLQYNGLLYSHLLHNLGSYYWDYYCHFDPVLDVSRYVHPPKDWKPAFGQCSSSLGYLMKSVEVEPGDLFLFFGWFRFVEQYKGIYQYKRKGNDFFDNHDFHLIWGYLQVGEIIFDYKEKSKKFPWHSHAQKIRKDDTYDAIFVARDKLTFAPNMPGAGMLPFSKKRILTMEGKKKGTWKNNKVYDPDHIIGNRNNNATDGGIYYSGIWQELGLKETKAAEDWAKKIVLAK